MLIVLIVIMVAVVGYIMATSNNDSPLSRPTPGPTVTPDPTPAGPDATLMPTEAPTPGPTPEPQPYDGIRIGFAAAQFSVAPPFPGHEYWAKAGKLASDKFPGATAEGVWVIGGVLQGGICYLNFPSSTQYSNIAFASTDENEPYLDYFDSQGISIILQVEPGLADVDTILKLVLDQYAHHPCVSGVGVDVEWNQAPAYWEGRPVTDEEAARWYKLINTYAWRSKTHASLWERLFGTAEKKYVLALTHWKTEKMPPTYREGIYFLYDGFRFKSESDMMRYCIDWGQSYPDNPVGYYIGFPDDRFWWGSNSDPCFTLGERLMKNIGNAKGVYWMGTSIRDICPE